jgi:hypothetical protein
MKKHIAFSRDIQPEPSRQKSRTSEIVAWGQGVAEGEALSYILAHQAGEPVRVTLSEVR